MQTLGILKILGILMALFSLTLLPPLAVSIYYADQAHNEFIVSSLIILVLGVVCWFPARHYRGELRFRDGFLVVVLIWVALSIMAAVPLVFVGFPDLGLVDALFESTSGLTTTGATILIAIDELPRSVLYYRQQLQWLGGMGIIVLAVAVMPALGVGGMQLYRAETPGPVKDDKLTPRITETAKAIWYIYLGLTITCGLAYYIAGMNVFDAVCHAFSTLAIGGFSTHTDSLGYFQSNAINLVAIIFMLLAGLNFALHFTAFRFKKLTAYINDPEAKSYFTLILLTCLLTIGVLQSFSVFEQTSDNIMQGLVQVVSIVTTTGFTTTDFSVWPTFIPVMLILLSTAGGCAGSTAGGMKIVRMMLLFKQGAREISRLIHPSALFPIKLGGNSVPDNVANAVWGFLSLYIFSFTLLLVAMLATGCDLVTALSAVTACLNNLGPGLGDVAKNYAGITDAGKIILTFAMLLGRLELFTLLVLVTPVFWKG